VTRRPLVLALVFLPTLALALAQDVFGRQVPAGAGPVIEIFANRETRDVIRDEATQLAWDARGAEPLVLVRIDLAGVPRLFRGMAQSEIRDSHARSLRRFRQLAAEQGEVPPEGMDRRLFFVADFEGRAHRQAGLREGFRTPLVRVLGPDGEELARGTLPGDADRILEALRR
jgi:hypothetical protein